MIKLITLKTNHTLMGDVIDDRGGVYKIKQPVQVVNVPPQGPQEAANIAFVPFLEYSEEFKTGISFDKVDVLTVNKPVIELENQYNAIFGSGIQIASAIPKF